MANGTTAQAVVAKLEAKKNGNGAAKKNGNGNGAAKKNGNGATKKSGGIRGAIASLQARAKKAIAETDWAAVRKHAVELEKLGLTAGQIALTVFLPEARVVQLLAKAPGALGKVLPAAGSAALRAVGVTRAPAAAAGGKVAGTAATLAIAKK